MNELNEGERRVKGERETTGKGCIPDDVPWAGSILRAIGPMLTNGSALWGRDQSLNEISTVVLFYCLYDIYVCHAMIQSHRRFR